MYGMLLVGLGSALGGMLRHGCWLFFSRLFGPAFPWGTLFVNVSGSFVIGGFFALTAEGGRLPVSPEWRLFVMTGICGGYTTFSSFSLQTLVLMQAGEWLLAALNVLGSVALCLAAVWLGFAGALAFHPRP